MADYMQVECFSLNKFVNCVIPVTQFMFLPFSFYASWCLIHIPYLQIAILKTSSCLQIAMSQWKLVILLADCDVTMKTCHLATLQIVTLKTDLVTLHTGCHIEDYQLACRSTHVKRLVFSFCSNIFRLCTCTKSGSLMPCQVRKPSLFSIQQ